MDQIGAAQFAEEQRPVAELRNDGADVLERQQSIERLGRNRVNGNNPSPDLRILSPAIHHALSLNRLTPENPERRYDDRYAEGAGRITHMAGSGDPLSRGANGMT
jgi:hypothetical protein